MSCNSRTAFSQTRALFEQITRNSWESLWKIGGTSGKVEKHLCSITGVLWNIVVIFSQKSNDIWKEFEFIPGALISERTNVHQRGFPLSFGIVIGQELSRTALYVELKTSRHLSNASIVSRNFFRGASRSDISYFR